MVRVSSVDMVSDEGQQCGHGEGQQCGHGVW